MDAFLPLLSFGDLGWGDEIARGFLVTLALALSTLPFGIVAGLGLALAKQSPDRALALAADIYTTIFRGLPELLTLFLVFYGGQAFLNAVAARAGFSTFEISPFVAGMLALGFVFSAFASEVFLSAFRAIPHGQGEAGRSLGLSRVSVLRFVVFPQLIRIALPGLSNVWLNLLKDTALVSVIGLADIMRQAGVAARVTREPFLFFGVACALYLVLTFASAGIVSWIDRWAKRGEVAR